MNAFRRYLKAQLQRLHTLADLPEYQDDDFQAAAELVAEAVRKASMLGLAGGWEKFAAVDTLAPQTAREILAQMIGATHKGRTAEPVSDGAPLTVAQAASRFNLGKRTIYRLVETGEIEAARVGKAIRIRPADLEAYLGRSQGPTAGLFG